MRCSRSRRSRAPGPSFSRRFRHAPYSCESASSARVNSDRERPRARPLVHVAGAASAIVMAALVDADEVGSLLRLPR